MNRLFVTAFAAIFIFTISVFGRVLEVPGTYPTIQQAINSTQIGDTVLVAVGNYKENINLKGKAILVTSRFMITNSYQTIRSTIIDGSHPLDIDSGSTVYFVSGETSSTELRGFTIVNGIGTNVPGSFVGGGIFINNESSPLIRYNIIRANNSLEGAGVGIRNASPTLEYNAICFNSANIGGGISITNSDVTLHHNTICNNSSTSSGGGIYINESLVECHNNIFADNDAQNGGGIYCEGGNLNITFSNFWNNGGGDYSGCDLPQIGDTTQNINFNYLPTDIYSNIFRDPMLTDVNAFNFIPLCDSPLIDAGSTIPKNYPVGGIKADIGMVEYPYEPGDMTEDSKINLTDITAMVNIVFSNSPLPCPLYVADIDCDRRFNISDIVALIGYWGGTIPPPCVYDVE